MGIGIRTFEEERKQERIKEAVKRLKKLQKNDDVEVAHSEADDILCELLREIGYEEVAKEWERVQKWYA